MSSCTPPPLPAAGRGESTEVPVTMVLTEATYLLDAAPRAYVTGHRHRGWGSSSNTVPASAQRR